MASLTECDSAFKELGFPTFTRQPSNDILNRVQIRRSQIETNDPELRSRLTYLLNNAVRCNSICSDSDSKQVCANKLTNYFDRVKSVERCSSQFRKCFYLLEPILEVGIVKSHPVYPKTSFFDTLMKNGHQIFTWSEISNMFPDLYEYLELPLNIPHENILYLVDSRTLQMIRSLSELVPIQLTPRGQTAVMSQSGRQCKSPCTQQRWGRWPLKRYGCWLDPSFKEFDLCDPNQ